MAKTTPAKHASSQAVDAAVDHAVAVLRDAVDQRLGTQPGAEVYRRTGVRNRAISDALRGEQRFTLRELIALGMACGLDLFDSLPRTREDLWSPDFDRRVNPSWQPGSVSAPEVGEWDVVVNAFDRTIRVINEWVVPNRLGLLGSDVLATRFIDQIIEEGVDGDQVLRPDGHPDRFVIDTDREVLLLVHLARDPQVVARRVATNLVERLLSIATTAADRRVAVIGFDDQLRIGSEGTGLADLIGNQAEETVLDPIQLGVALPSMRRAGSTDPVKIVRLRDSKALRMGGTKLELVLLELLVAEQ